MKLRNNTVFIILLFLAILSCAPALRAVILPVAEDTSSTIAGKINQTTGKAVTLSVTPKEQAFLIFDLANLPASVTANSITSARLNLYVSSLVTRGELTVHLVTNEWQESTATVPAPGIASNVVGTIPAADLVAKSFIEVDVTVAVSNWFNGATNFGFAIATAAGNVRLGSKEGLGTGFPAMLEIETAVNAALLNVSQLTNGTLPPSSLPGAVVTNTEAGVTLGGKFSGNGAQLTNAAGYTFADTNVVHTVSNSLSSQIAAVGTQVTDIRTVRNSDIKGVAVGANVPTTIYSNTGPATIQSIRVAWYNTSSVTTNVSSTSPAITIAQDGASNSCQLLSFFAAEGFPNPFHGDVIDLASCTINPGTNVWASGQRLVQINCQTSGSISVTFAYPVILYSDVFYRVGPTPMTNTWHVIEAQEMIPFNASFTPFNISGSSGRIESIYMFALANGGLGYLEAKPVLQLDGASVILGNGTEDSFGGSFYWNNGQDHYATPQWGNQSETFLQYKYGFSDGNLSYRFMNGAYFSNSASLSYPNYSGNSLSNDWLITYYTTP